MPKIALDKSWDYLNPIVFSTAGALLTIDKLSKSLVGTAICIILVSVSFKCIMCMIMSYKKGWTFKEKIFLSVC